MDSGNIFVYAIKSQKDGRIYVGMAVNVEKRLFEHNSGKTKSTKGYRPWNLIFTEKCTDRLVARSREKYWKGGTGKEQLKSLLSNIPNLDY
jgi:putative endonuclease